ncbi:MAG: pitrilysin family protein [Candidatus Falkowbacteria bacterium]|nr:pitrilysin family protein [Candidatus Falkowbacteria bacterium]
MKIKDQKLSNGLRLIQAPLPGTRTATVLIIYKTGSKYEDRKTSGLSHFLEHVMFKGTDKRPNAAVISNELDSIGGEYNAFTSKEFTGYYIKADTAKFTRALDIISDMVTNSKFADEEINKERGVIIEEANMYDANPMMKIEDVLEQVLYGDTPAGWDTVGFKENIKRWDSEDFKKYFDSQYGVNSATLVFAGNLPKDANKLAEKFFATLPKNKWHNKLAVKEKQSTPQLLVVNKKIEQTIFSLGVRTFKSGSKEEAATKLLGVILGGSMSSRLFSEVREKRGLAYSVRANVEFYSDCGYLTAVAGVKNEKLEEALNAVLSEFKKVKEELIPTVEIKKAKDLISGRLAIQLEASDDVANWYGFQSVLRHEVLSPEAALKKIRTITALDLQKVAKQIFKPERLNLAIIGPIRDQNKLKAILKKFK